MSERTEQQVTAREGVVSAERDALLGAMDSEQALERLLAAVRVFIDKGFETHLIGIKQRDGIEWRIELHADGLGPVDIRDLTGIGDQQRLQLYVDKVEGQKIGIVAFARS